LRRGERSVDAGVIDLLMGCNDRIGVLVSELDQHQVEQSPVDDLVARITEALEGEKEPVAEDKGEVPPAPPQEPKNAPVSVYNEEYDKELFAIFLDQLNTNLQALTDEAEQIRAAQPADPVLDRCMELVSTLRSSANYMEYEELRALYDSWLEQIQTTRGQLASGTDFNAEELIQEVLLSKIDRVRQFFTAESPTEEITPIEENPPIEVVAPDGGTDLAAAIADQFKDLDPGLESVSLDDFADDDQFAVLDDPVDTGEDLALLDKLASAFDARLGTSIESMEQSLPEDIENHLLSGDVTGMSSLAAQEEPILQTFDEDQSSVEPIGDLDADREGQVPEPEQPVEAARSGLAEAMPVSEEAPGKASVPQPTMEAAERRTRYDFGRRQSDKYHDRVQKQSLRVDAAKIDALMNQVGELVVSRSGFNQLFAEMRELQLILKQSQKLNTREMQQIKEITNRISEATTSLGRVTAELQENVMKVRMLPIAQLFSRYPRLVHDLVRNTHKKVNLEILGEETELDKMVIEQLADPLIHIIRNAVDHGIEDETVRRQKGKPVTGALRLEAYHEGNFVVIEVSDDGRGIDVALIRKRALEKGFVSEEELSEMNEQQIMTLIMRPGFSTADTVTHTSGRGVGMDVVKDSIEKLNGTIDISSTLGTGARFKIRIPLTLAIIPALLVRLAEEIFTIPLSAVEETIRVNQDAIQTIEGLEVFNLRDETIALIRLDRLFKMASEASRQRSELFVVIVNTGTKQVGFVVDELVARQEVVIKPLEDYLQEKSGFSGATILGDGSISLILDVFQLVELSLDQHNSKVGIAAI
jgi:two-component system, chemotaxis family, sensor kinase CheA